MSTDTLLGLLKSIFRPSKFQYYQSYGSGSRPIRAIQIRCTREEWEPFVEMCQREGVTNAHCLWRLVTWLPQQSEEIQRLVIGDERSPGAFRPAAGAEDKE